jgi:hypothetical protein
MPRIIWKKNREPWPHTYRVRRPAYVMSHHERSVPVNAIAVLPTFILNAFEELMPACSKK